jgi:arginyl-tRNA synthetase
MDQTLHFKQVFSVLKRMGYAWWNKCHHISFGMYRFKDVGKMSSRKGQIIRFEDLLNRALEIVKDLMRQKNPNLPDFEKIAEQVAVGAIIFNDLVNDRVRDVEFDWDKALSFEGDSGPYLQYVHVRCQSMIQKYGLPLPDTVVALTSDEERELIKCLMRYEDILRQSFVNFRPSILAGYLLDVAAAFNRFYHNHKIIGGDQTLAPSRMALVSITQQVIRAGLKVLNIQSPMAM